MNLELIFWLMAVPMTAVVLFLFWKTFRLRSVAAKKLPSASIKEAELAAITADESSVKSQSQGKKNRPRWIDALDLVAEPPKKQSGKGPAHPYQNW